MSTGALDGLARAPDPQRQRACCELMELLTADGAGMTADLLASLPLPPGAENGEILAMERPREECHTSTSAFIVLTIVLVR